MSIQWEFEKSPTSVIYLFSVTYAVAIAFSIISCWRLVKRLFCNEFALIYEVERTFHMNFTVNLDKEKLKFSK